MQITTKRNLRQDVCAIAKLLRPEQWVKNGFVLLPLFFDRHLLDLDYIIPTLMAFFAFCFIASSIYCFNDIYDVEADRKHPKKCKRPIASGAISIRGGRIVMIISVLLSAMMVALEFVLLGHLSGLWLVILTYFIMNIAYTIRLKNVAILDVFIIALGFVLRVVAGGIVTGIYISHWIILMTFLLSLFLAFAKRRDDVVIYQEKGVLARKNISRYNLDFMNLAMTIVAAMTMICYVMYTVSEEVMERMGSQFVYVTSVFVLAGIIKYLQIALVDVKSGSPTKILLKDRFIQACIIGWILTFIVILYI